MLCDLVNICNYTWLQSAIRKVPHLEPNDDEHKLYSQGEAYSNLQ
jgi:hypothetical protein